MQPKPCKKAQEDHQKDKDNRNNFLYSYFGTHVDSFQILRGLKGLGILPDTMSLKLTEVCDSLGIVLENAHNALADIKANKELIEKLAEIISVDLSSFKS